MRNKKVRNATKCAQDGVKFDSKLEKCMYNLLKNAGIEFDFQPKQVLQEGFRFGDEKIRPITYTPDFFLPGHNMYIDTKGHQTEPSKIKIKIFKWLHANSFTGAKFEMPRTPNECQVLVWRLQGLIDGE